MSEPEPSPLPSVPAVVGIDELADAAAPLGREPAPPCRPRTLGHRRRDRGPISTRDMGAARLCSRRRG